MQRSTWIERLCAIALALAALLIGGNGRAQLFEAAEMRLVSRGGALQFLPDYGTRLEGLERVTDSTHDALSQMRPRRQALLQRSRSGDLEARNALTELECTTACLHGTDQDWCRANRANEWVEWDLTLPCNEATGACRRCDRAGDHDGQCQWHQVQAISAYKCSSVRRRSLIAAQSGARIAAADRAQEETRLAAVQDEATRHRVTVEGQRDQAIRERDAARTELANTRTRLLDVQTQLHARTVTQAAQGAGESRTRSRAARRPAHAQEGETTSPDSDDTNDEEGLNERACTIESRTRTSVTTRCPMPRHFDEAVLGTSRLAGRSATAAEFSSLAPRYRPYLRQIAEILHLNNNARDCRGAILFACHADSPTPGHTYVYRRIGVCSGVEGQGTSPVTLADFVTIAQRECSQHPEVTLQGVPGLLLRLRRTRVPIAADDTRATRAAEPSDRAQRALMRAVSGNNVTATMLAHVDNGHFTPSREMMTFTPPPAVASVWQDMVQVVRPMFAGFAETTRPLPNTCPVRPSGSSSATCGVRVATAPTANTYRHIDGSEAPHGTPGPYQILTD